MPESMADQFEILIAVTKVDAQPEVLEAIAAIASERARNARLREERDWLERRISEEDARLAHA